MPFFANACRMVSCCACEGAEQAATVKMMQEILHGITDTRFRMLDLPLVVTRLNG